MKNLLGLLHVKRLGKPLHHLVKIGEGGWDLVCTTVIVAGDSNGHWTEGTRNCESSWSATISLRNNFKIQKSKFLARKIQKLHRKFQVWLR